MGDIPGMISRGKAVLIDAVSHFNDSDGWAMASHVALSIVMALFPFLIFATSFAGIVGSQVKSETIVNLVFATWPDEIAQPIVHEIDAVLNADHAGFLSIGIALALFFASNGIEAIRTALNRAYRTSESRSFVFCRLQSLLFVIFGSVLLSMVSFLLLIAPPLYALAKETFPDFAGYDTTMQVLRYTLSLAGLLFLVFACHAWLPAKRPPISKLWPGILTCLTAWLAAGTLFAAYLKSFAHYSATFAGLAGIITVLVFLYLMAVILVAGGELNAALLNHREQAAGAPRS